MLMSLTRAEELGVRAMAGILSTATRGIEPEIMGIGPVSATKKALQRAGMILDHVDPMEVNEAFAAQYLGCEKALNLGHSSTLPVVDELLCESWIPRAAFHDLSWEYIA